MAGRVYITKRDMAYKNILADMKLNGQTSFHSVSRNNWSG